MFARRLAKWTMKLLPSWTQERKRLPRRHAPVWQLSGSSGLLVPHMPSCGLESYALRCVPRLWEQEMPASE
jgi:hypothetical protein